MKRAKPKKKSIYVKQVDPKVKHYIVRNSNYVAMSLVIRTLWEKNGWRRIRIDRFVESYMVLIEEVADRRSNPWKSVDEASEIIGIDIVELLNELFGWHINRRAQKKAETPIEVVKLANYVAISIAVRTLWDLYGFREKRISRFIHDYADMVNVYGDNEGQTMKCIADTQKLTGVEVVKLLNEVYGWRN